jgi:hypothetical protein
MTITRLLVLSTELVANVNINIESYNNNII